MQLSIFRLFLFFMYARIYSFLFLLCVLFDYFKIIIEIYANVLVEAIAIEGGDGDLFDQERHAHAHSHTIYSQWNLHRYENWLFYYQLVRKQMELPVILKPVANWSDASKCTDKSA